MGSSTGIGQQSAQKRQGHVLVQVVFLLGVVHDAVTLGCNQVADVVQ